MVVELHPPQVDAPVSRPLMLDGQGKARYRVRMQTNCEWQTATLREAEALARELMAKHGDMFLLSIAIERLNPLGWLKGWTRWPSGWKKIKREVGQ